MLDLSHDFQIPVMVAVGQHKESDRFSLGLGCHLDATLACQRALTELCQILPIREQGVKFFDFNDIEAEPFLFPDSTQTKKLLESFINRFF